MPTTSSSPERKFIHDLANPLVTAMFVVDAYLAKLALQSAESPELQRAYAALERMQQLLAERRALLIGAEAEKAKP